jgi:hypothetical protein
MPGGEIPGELQGGEMTEERKFAILFAATILAARKLIDRDPNKPNMAKQFYVDRAIDDAAFILERIDARWPAIVNSFSAKDSEKNVSIP